MIEKNKVPSTFMLAGLSDVYKPIIIAIKTSVVSITDDIIKISCNRI